MKTQLWRRNPATSLRYNIILVIRIIKCDEGEIDWVVFSICHILRGVRVGPAQQDAVFENWQKDTIYCRICWTAFYMCLICVLCVVIGIVRLIRASDRSLTLNWYPHLALNTSCQCNAVSARDTHALILSRQKFQMSELQLCKHCVLTDNWGDEGWEWDLDCVRATGNTSS